ncbi:MAG: hypothetical protein RL751_1614 [Bacteroidota bacterium]
MPVFPTQRAIDHASFGDADLTAKYGLPKKVQTKEEAIREALLDRMLAREKRSGIIVMSSGLGSAPIPGVLTYSMSKSFSSKAMRSVRLWQKK